MPSSAKKDGEKKQKQKKNGESSSKKEIVVPPSDNEQDDQVKKSASKQGFSILNSLAKFMSREKSETTTAAMPPPETVEEVESTLIKPEYNEVSIQTSDLTVRRSSTLTAISKAVQALKEVRRRVALHAKKKTTGEIDTLQPEETQTSDSLLPTESDFRKHDVHSSMHAKTLHDDKENKSQGHHSNSMPAESRGFHQEGRKLPQASHSHVTFRGDADHYEINITSIPSEASNTGGVNVETTTTDNDDNNFDGGGQVLFRSTPKSGKGISKAEKLPPTIITFKNATFQTEPEMTIRGTQTSSPRVVVNDSQVGRTDHAESENSLVRRILQDREKCSKCDLFELMFLHGGERVLNDEEMLGMFKRHMNTHLLKAQEDLNKLYKWPQRVAEIADISGEEQADQRKIFADRERVEKEMAIRTSTNPRNNFDENKYREDELTSSSTHGKSEIGTPPRVKQVNADDDESREDIEKNLNSGNFSETKGVKRDTSQRRYSRSHSSSFERILQDYFASRKRDCSEEVIIRRKNCRNHNDERNGYDDGYYYSENVDSRRRNLHPRYDREIEKDSSWNRNGRCFCERFKFVPVTNLINSGYGNGEDYDECNYKCVGTSTNFPSNFTHHRKMEDSSEMESQLKWFVKGMLAALKGHHDVKSTERKEKVESSSREKQQDDTTFKDEENMKARQGKGHNRGSSVLSDISFSMVKENAKTKRSSDDQKGEEGEKRDSSAGKQDMKNKINSGPDTQTQDNALPASPGANKLELNSSAEDGKSGGNGLHKTLSEPKLQDLVQDILSAFCTKFPAQEGNIRRNGCETPADLNSCCEANQDEIVQQVCSILKPTNVPARVSTTQANSNDNAEGKGYKGGGEQQERVVCSYFYPFCDDNDSNTYWDRFSCYRSSNQAESCCCDNGRKNSDCNCCSLPLQESFKRYHTVCYRRVKMRQTCLSNCKKERESQQMHKQSLVKAASKCSRPFTATKTRQIENGFCGCSINSARDQDPCEGFTYVVPQNQMYWKCL